MKGGSVGAAALVALGAAGVGALLTSGGAEDGSDPSRTGDRTAVRTDRGTSAVSDSLARATFAGGCFWCMEPPFDGLDGVVSTTSGYAGGHVANPTYEEVSSGGTGHREAVQVVYDPDRVGYGELLDVFWHNVDPTDAGGQFCDRGHQYTTAIFYHGPDQKQLAERSKERLESSGRFREPLATEILPLDRFWPAEDYHQDYYREHPIRYKFYRANCGRDRVLKRLWGADAGGH